MSNASRVLKIARSTLYRKMKDFDLPKRPSLP
jgi:transcriptional regulator of acetoin/glycerol metabolism